MVEATDSFEFLQLQAALLAAGCDVKTVTTMELMCKKLLARPSGYRHLGFALKGWKSQLIDIMSRDSLKAESDGGHPVSFSRLMIKSSHTLRALGWTDLEISEAVLYHKRRRIPPFLYDPALVDILRPDFSYEVAKRMVSLVNISRTAPIGQIREIRKSIQNFQENVTKTPEWSFDLRGVVRRMFRTLSATGSKRSRWELTFKSSREFSRAKGGKHAEFVKKFYDIFCYLPVSEFIPEVCPVDLLDITGSVVLAASTYSLDDRFYEVCYPQLGINLSDVADSRLGQLGLFWSLWELRKNPDLEFDADEDYVNLKRLTPPSLRLISGFLDSRVEPVAEPGLKVRIVTITDLAPTLIGAVSRHCVDDLITNLDESNKIGLTSKVKLYDWMVHLNAKRHTGIADQNHNSLNFEYGTSVDLTTATDTPCRQVVRSVLMGVADVASPWTRNLLHLGIDLATSTRRFFYKGGLLNKTHYSGIMMGEGLTGIFLNTSSSLIRYTIPQFVDAFPDYTGLTISDADQFIKDNHRRIQLFFDEVRIERYLNLSIQSGDDLCVFSYKPVSRHLMLYYRIFNFKPSVDSWYESKSFLTFTEEIAIRTKDSQGWTFVDCVKPRLFRPLDVGGETAVASRVKQIGDSLRYLSNYETTNRLIPLVDKMLSSCRSLERVISKRSIPVGLPTWLGGLGHPIGMEPGYLLTLDQRYRDLMKYMMSFDFESLAEVFCIGELLDDSDKNRLLMCACVSTMTLGEEVFSIEEVTGNSWINLSSLKIQKDQCEKYSHWVHRKRKEMEAAGLSTVIDIAAKIQSIISITESLNGAGHSDIPIAHRIRRKQEYLLTKVLDDDHLNLGDSIDGDIFPVYREIQNRLHSRYWNVESLFEELSFSTAPSFSVGFQPLRG